MLFIRPDGSVTGSILVADLPEQEPAKKRGRPRKAATEVAANPEPEPQPEPELQVTPPVEESAT